MGRDRQCLINMDHNLDDSLNLESAMGVDFESSEDVIVSEGAIALEHSTHEESIPMEFEHSEEQPMLMDTGSEEIIVSDFMADQFSLQEYSVQSDQTTGLTTTLESNQQQMLSTQSVIDSMIDLQYQPQIVSAIKTEVLQSNLLTVKTVPPLRPTTKKVDTILTTAPRQVAIAPKPSKLVTKTYAQNRQLPIAPKPVKLISNRGTSLVKKVSIAGVVQGNTKGNTVLAQFGKQLIMVPSGSQKIKLVSSAGAVPNIQYIRADSDQAQLIATKNISGALTKPVMTKLITMQGQTNVDQPAIITKLTGGNTKSSQPRFVTMQQKTMPISIGNKVLLATPSKQGVKLAKKQEIIAIKSPTPKILPAPSLVPVSSSAKKVVITPNSAQNVILKTTAPPKTAQVIKDSNVAEGQRSQLHQISVPGKGIQYVRIFTNSVPAPKPAPKQLVTINSKTFVLTDNKGNLLQMTAEKMSSGQPPSLVVAGNANSNSKVAAKPPQKLVRIAPVVPKTTQAVMQPGRSSQSLLAPLSPVPSTDRCTTNTSKSEEQREHSEEEEEQQADVETDETDSKSALRALIESTVSEDVSFSVNEVEVEFKHQHSSLHDTSLDSAEQLDSSARSDEQHPFIVLPAQYEEREDVVPEGQDPVDNSQRTSDSVIMDEDTMNETYQPPTTPTLSETDIISTELPIRPRKACNCTKSQCLKLYCDCFANGEFCNRCNCNNCHNNLENEELRQKAIRGCLERNPNAFRPKIGKAKSGGLDIVRRHNKGCNCKRSGCLKNYCECYEAKIACTAICKCVGCRNVEETLERGRRRNPPPANSDYRPPPLTTITQPKQPCSFMTTEVIEAVCQCLIAAAVDPKEEQRADHEIRDADPMRDVIEEFARCLQDIISAAHQTAPLTLLDEEAA